MTGKLATTEIYGTSIPRLYYSNGIEDRKILYILIHWLIPASTTSTQVLVSIGACLVDNTQRCHAMQIIQHFLLFFSGLPIKPQTGTYSSTYPDRATITARYLQGTQLQVDTDTSRHVPLRRRTLTVSGKSVQPIGQHDFPRKTTPFRFGLRDTCLPLRMNAGPSNLRNTSAGQLGSDDR